VGLFDRLKGKGHTLGSGAVLQGPGSAAATPWSAPQRQPVSAPQRGSEWLPPHSVRYVAGYTIAGGLIYLGSRLVGPRSGGTDPALINPALKVGGVPNRSGQGLAYWGGYSALSPESRAAYLEWLSSGRNNPHVPIGYVCLYFYGLERRLLVDLADPRQHQPEIVFLRTEIQRLITVYGSDRAFRAHAAELLAVADLKTGFRNHVPPVYAGEKWPAPSALRSALGEFSRDRVPIPAEWAMAWALFHPEIYPRTPATRCPEEFASLFSARYAKRFGPGMVVAAPKRSITFYYRPANLGLQPAQWNTGLPDIFELVAPGKKLATLVAECTDELDAYSRWLGRFPDSRKTLAAIALLPPELVDAAREPVSTLLRRITRPLAATDPALVEGNELARAWSGGQKEALTKQESVAFAQLLGRQGIGVEPDPRFGGGPIGGGPALLFRTDAGSGPEVASGAYTAATAVLRLAAAVAVADSSSFAEQDFLFSHLSTALDLAPAEAARLRAHLSLLLAAPVKLTGMAARLTALRADEREQIAALCVAVAAADGTVAPAEVTTLKKIYKLLGLPDSRLYHDVHVATTPAAAPAASVVTFEAPSAPVDEPVVVQRATGTGEAVHLIPAPPKPAPPPRSFALDRGAIAVKIAETADVSALLGSIFVDEEETARSQPAADPETALVAGLDARHSRLFHRLAEAEEWSRAAVEDLCAELGLLTDGAIDTLNDAAYETAGDPLIEGADPLSINFDAMREMQK
jgi:uncharacterized tellurite resistance protein B-like protein